MVPAKDDYRIVRPESGGEFVAVAGILSGCRRESGGSNPVVSSAFADSTTDYHLATLWVAAQQFANGLLLTAKSSPVL